MNKLLKKGTAVYVFSRWDETGAVCFQRAVIGSQGARRTNLCKEDGTPWGLYSQLNTTLLGAWDACREGTIEIIAIDQCADPIAHAQAMSERFVAMMRERMEAQIAGYIERYGNTDDGYVASMRASIAKLQSGVVAR